MISSPHIARRVSVSRIMLTVVAALLPGVVLSTWLIGIGVLIQIGLAVGAALCAEVAMLRIRRVPVEPYLRDGSAILTGCLIGIAFPALGAWWLVVVASVFAIVVVKQSYGGLGNNPFNPAMAGYALMVLSFPAQMSQWPPLAVEWNSYDQLLWILTRTVPEGKTFDVFTHATPLDVMRTMVMTGQAAPEVLMQMWPHGVWSAPQMWLAGAWLLGGLFLLQQKIIDWRTPVGFLLALGALAAVMSAVDTERYPSVWFHLVSGATMFGAWFIVTDPVTCSTTPRGKWIFGLGVGGVVYVIRTWGGFPDAVAFAVLVMNMTVPFMDRYLRPPSFGGKTRRKGVSS